jgi:predicted glycosyltransferase
MPAKQQKQIQHKASFCSRVKILEFSDDLMSYIDAADLVVCMSGYNTICEVLSQKKLAIAVPRLKPSLEQIIRAKRMQELGWIETIHPQELTPKLLIDKVLEELEANNRLPKIPPIDLNGLSYLTEKISDLLPLGDREPIKMVL